MIFMEAKEISLVHHFFCSSIKSYRNLVRILRLVLLGKTHEFMGQFEEADILHHMGARIEY